MLIINNVDINLKDTITCGQIFRYTENEDNSYTVILSDRVVNLKMDNNDLIIESNNYNNLENIIINYLDLNRDYTKLNNELLNIDASLDEVINSSKGLKMINQPRFECIISYIISQNNKVSQISKVLNNISKKYGKKVVFNNKEYYLFPEKEELKNVSVLEYRNLKAGFRDKYLYDFVQNINNGNIDINYIDTLSSEDALNYLMNNKGIGEKVASCILLFSYSRFDVFPIDTWVKKYMKDKYDMTSKNEIKNYMKEKYKNNCGLVIQYLFHYNRNKKRD